MNSPSFFPAMKPESPYSVLLRQRRETLLPEVQKLALEGHGPAMIAEILGMPKSTVTYWLKGSRSKGDTWRPQVSVDLPTHVLDCYYTIYRAAMTGWRCSRNRKIVRPAEDPGHEDPSKQNRSSRRVIRAGNPIFLTKAMEALKAIRDFKGLDAPRRTELTGMGGGPFQLAVVMDEDLRNMSNEQLAALERESETRIRESEARILEEEARNARLALVHELHQARLPPQGAPQDPGRDARSGGDGPLPAADGLPPAPARQE
jgi:hypothetical protein